MGKYRDGKRVAVRGGQAMVRPHTCTQPREQPTRPAARGAAVSGLTVSLRDICLGGASTRPDFHGPRLAAPLPCSSALRPRPRPTAGADGEPSQGRRHRQARVVRHPEAVPAPETPVRGPEAQTDRLPRGAQPHPRPAPAARPAPLPSPSEAQRPTHPRVGVPQDRLFKLYAKRNPDWELEEIKMHRKAVAEGYKTRGYHFVNLWQKYIEAGLQEDDAYDKAPARPALSRPLRAGASRPAAPSSARRGVTRGGRGAGQFRVPRGGNADRGGGPCPGPERSGPLLAVGVVVTVVPCVVVTVLSRATSCCRRTESTRRRWTRQAPSRASRQPLRRSSRTCGRRCRSTPPPTAPLSQEIGLLHLLRDWTTREDQGSRKHRNRTLCCSLARASLAVARSAPALAA